MKNKPRMPTTLGDLIAAAGELAFEYSNSDREAYNLAQFALVEILRKTATPQGSDEEFENLPSPSELVH